MLQPVRRRTWAPRGQTPIQYAWDRHDRLSAMSVITVSPVRRQLGLYFQLVPHNIHTEDVIWFLTQMHRHFRHKVIMVWDRWSVHRSAARWFQQHHPDWFDFEWLPAYAPELNPVEQCWSHTKYADLSNFIPKDVDHLHEEVTASILKQSNDKALLHSFFDHAKLSV